MTLEHLRRRLPLLAARQYFASHSLGPVPDEALADLARWQSSLLQGRGALGAWIAQMSEVTALLERLLGAPAGSVVLMPGATVAQATIAAALRPDGRRHIITTAVDFHSSRYLWAAQVARGFDVQTLGVAADGGVALPELIAALRPETAAVAVAHVSSFTGAMLPLEPLVRAAHDAGAIVIADACQSVGIVPIDVVASDVDVLVGCTHKWIGGGDFGLAFMYVRPALAAAWEPGFPGWMGHRAPQAVAPVFVPADGAARFSQSPVAIAPVFAARAGLALIDRVGVEILRARSVVLTERMLSRARVLGLRVRSPADPARRGGHVCIVHPHAERVVTALHAAGFDVDARDGFGVRVAPHPAHRDDECDAVIDAIASVHDELARPG
jgi:kynureninase